MDGQYEGQLKKKKTFEEKKISKLVIRSATLSIVNISPPPASEVNKTAENFARPKQLLHEDELYWLIEFLDRSDISFMNPGCYDHVYVWKFEANSRLRENDICYEHCVIFMPWYKPNYRKYRGTNAWRRIWFKNIVSPTLRLHQNA